VDERVERWAELAVSGANVQPGQILIVNAEHGHADLARAVVAAAYRRGARFVEVSYFDPHVKRARIEFADADTLDFVPEWLGHAMVAHGEGHGARIALASVTEPHLFDDLDPERAAKDRLPRLKESGEVLAARTVNWCGIAAPHPAWAKLVYPELSDEDAYDRLWVEIGHVLRLDEPDPVRAWEERMAALADQARRLTERRFDAIHLEGPGTDLTVGLFQSAHWLGGGLETVDGLRHFPNLPTEEVFAAPDPVRVEGYVTATKPLVLIGGAIIQGLRMRFEGGRAVDIDADENGAALRHLVQIDEGATRLGELALVDRSGRVGPLGTVFYHSLLDENAASHIALGSAFSFVVEDEAERLRANTSALHIDFMIGSPELDVTGITVAGERVPVLRGGDWQV
jgi:aminopeptidase